MTSMNRRNDYKKTVNLSFKALSKLKTDNVLQTPFNLLKGLFYNCCESKLSAAAINP